MNECYCVQVRTGESLRISTLYFDTYEEAMEFINAAVFEDMFNYSLVMFKKL